jgi:undecaprenyl-phosphate 4-deoxy-4-formamido-L-arabinose transferase
MLSFVIPAYNSEKTLRELCLRINSTFSDFEKFELIIVDDYSSDNTWDEISALCLEYNFIIGVKLSRNFGQHNALLCGIRKAKGSLIITMDDDLQHPPEEIPQLIEKLRKGFDVVYGSPKSPSHNLGRIMASKLTKLVLQKTMGAKVASHISALRIFKTELREAFAYYHAPSVNIDVLLTWGTLNFGMLKVDHQPRRIGSSGYTTIKLIKHALNMMTGFTTRPLKFASVLGFLFSFFGIIVFCYVMIIWLQKGSTVPGFPFLASLISIFSGAQLISLGIIGEYLGRIHIKGTDRPSYNISKILN